MAEPVGQSGVRGIVPLAAAFSNRRLAKAIASVHLYQLAAHCAGHPETAAESLAQAIASVYQISSHATGLALQNAMHSQQALNQISNAVVAKAVALIMAISEKH